MLVLAVVGAEDSVTGDSFGALVVGEEGLGLRVVGVGLGLVPGAAVEETVEVVAVDGSRVLRGLLGAGGELGCGDAVSRGTSVETEVLEVLLMEVVVVVLCVVRGGTTCGTVECSWVKVAGKKHRSLEDEGGKSRKCRWSEASDLGYKQKQQCCAALSISGKKGTLVLWVLSTSCCLDCLLEREEMDTVVSYRTDPTTCSWKSTLSGFACVPSRNTRP